MDSPARILIVDDLEANRLALAAHLAALPCEVECVANGNEALRRLLKTEYAAMLLDVQMPEIDGYEVARLARENPGTREIPIIFVTATAETEESMLRGYGAGAVDLIFKPVNPSILRSKVEVFLDLWNGRRRLAQEIEAHKRALVEVESSRKALVASEARLRAANEEIARISRAEIAEERKGRAQAEVALRSTEEQLRHAQKMEAVGRLAGGVAHDFNNLLTIVLSYSAMLLDDLPPGDAKREDVEEIRKAGLRAADLTRQLLAFSRQQVLQPRVLDPNEVVEGMKKMIGRLVGEDVETSFTAAARGRVLCDPGQIEQILMNLVVNARDAMPNGGRLTIETADAQLDEDYARAHVGVTPGPYVMIAVSDTGMGMDPETQARIFEPFFTTKEKGKGTGLGLSTVYGIVRQSAGSIWLYSEPGQGTTFKVYLPRTDRSDAPEKKAKPSPPRRGSETVLLVEDEPQIRTLARGVLTRNGYVVLDAENGEKALDLCRSHEGTIHLVLTDVIMPRMSGRELVNRIAELRPESRVLFISGYTDNVIIHHGVLDGGAFLQKPITPDMLLAKVRELLDASPGRFEVGTLATKT